MHYQTNRGQGKVKMLLTLAVILLVLALIGGIAVHPLLFLLALLALAMFFSGRGRTVP
jgi:4-hydroxybenzoate polyprenyltransferase